MQITAAFIGLFLLLWALFTAAAPALRRGGAFVANRMTRSLLRTERAQRLLTYAARYRDYLPLVAIAVIGTYVVVAAGDAFLDLAELLLDKSARLEEFDSRVHRWAISQRQPGSSLFFILMTLAGTPVALATLVAIVTVFFLLRRRYRWAAYLVITTAGGGVINMELKRYFARSRPLLVEMLRESHGYSFPSGHAMGSAIVFGALSYLAFRALPRWRWKAAALALACTLIAAISLSRVYLGAHWISDIGAGAAAGTLWVAVTTVTYEMVRRIRMLRALRRERGMRAQAP
ncbi:MAG TPA: phosphatase PAP2 family protein [Thermoanaerobaculia bacterium]|nr:phosphatase PAP2 family protein [Thermoanaerobaculia bacterium]